MIIDGYSILLFVVVTWPLLLAFPAVHKWLPLARYMLLIPVILLVLIPGEITVTPAWLLFGAGFELDNNNRWLLVMAIVIWFAAAATFKNINNKQIGDTTFSFFSLTLAGHFGTILSADIVSFFCCSTLMGYGFYGLLQRQDNKASIWAGRFYISFLIIADLLLFESILLAAHGTDKLHYTFLHKAILDGAIPIAYVWLVSIAFIIKAGIWPAHIWLTTSFNSAARPAYLLLGGVPVVMGLLGLIRWIPAGEKLVSEWGIYFQVLGVITVLYALIQLINKGYQSMLPALVTLLMTGLFIAGLGTAMAKPEMWSAYHYLAYPFLALLGVISAILCFMQDNQPQTEVTLLKRLIERGLRMMNRLQNANLSSIGKYFGLKAYTRITSTQSTSEIDSAQRPGLIDAIESQIRSWPVIITILAIFLLVIILLASLAA
ncbi:MAG: proton-conducting transporter membrane subunit [Thioalkalispiraceae bacterium]